MSYQLINDQKHFIITSIEDESTQQKEEEELKEDEENDKFKDRFPIFINKTTSEIETKTGSSPKPKVSIDDDDENRCLIIKGIIGFITLKSGKYLIVITNERFIEKLNGSEIYQLLQVKIIPFSTGAKEKETSLKDFKYLQMLRSLLHEENFFYYTKRGILDLSSIYQNQIDNEFEYTPNKEYIWNYHLVPMKYRKIRTNLFVKIIQGSIEYFTENKIKFFLISRRNSKMAGTRYHRRGIDIEGNVANYVETDQILIDGKMVSSFLIVRGSIPLVWTQKVDMRYNPKMNYSKIGSKESKKAFKKHCDDMKEKYWGNVCCIDLTKNKGSEKRLKDEFDRAVKELKSKNVKYISFDIAKICGHTKFDKLSILKKESDNFFKKHGYSSNITKQRQTGVLRVNCKDSLDRTNMVQSYFSKFIVESILKDMNKIKVFGSIEDLPEFHKKVKYAWSDNGDTISRLYSGTGALRTDVTRDGKQTILGLVNDGKKSVMRYYQNNLADGYKQDCIDLFTNNFETLNVKADISRGIIIAILLWFFYFLKPRTTPDHQKYFIGTFFCLIWLLIFMIFFYVFFQDGKKLVQTPTVCRDEYKKKKKKKKED